MGLLGALPLARQTARIVADCEEDTEHMFTVELSSIIFSFNLFDENGKAGKHYRSFRSGSDYRTNMTYRLGGNEVKTVTTFSEYSNVANIAFFEADTSQLNPTLDTVAKLLGSKRLVARLPIQGMEPYDIEIDLQGLEKFFASCPVAMRVASHKR